MDESWMISTLPDDWGERDGWIGIDVLDCVTEVEMQRMYGHELHFYLFAVFEWMLYK